MRRCALLVLSTTMLMAGCFGRDSYEKRMTDRLDKLRYERRIKANLMARPADKKFEDLAIAIQPPKDEELTRTSQLPVAEGQYELDASFVDKAGPVLHLLARVKLPKKAPVKGAPAPPPPTQRGEFTRDVLAVLTGVYPQVEGLMTPKFVDEKKGNNRFKRLVTTVSDRGGERELKLYTYKEGNHEAALVFVYDPKLRGTLGTKIDLCLETFAAGARATRVFGGGQADDEEAAGGGGTNVPM